MVSTAAVPYGHERVITIGRAQLNNCSKSGRQFARQSFGFAFCLLSWLAAGGCTWPGFPRLPQCSLVKRLEKQDVLAKSNGRGQERPARRTPTDLQFVEGCLAAEALPSEFEAWRYPSPKQLASGPRAGIWGPDFRVCSHHAKLPELRDHQSNYSTQLFRTPTLNSIQYGLAFLARKMQTDGLPVAPILWLPLAASIMYRTEGYVVHIS